jgi:flagellar basal-body rod protein FlgF
MPFAIILCVYSIKEDNMIKGIYNSSAGMLPRYQKLVTVSNNIANASTVAFKVNRQYFTTTMNAEMIQPGSDKKAEKQEELDKGLVTDFGQGALYHTGTETDMGINGDGFFVVEDPETNDVSYTRDGRFRLNLSNELVTTQGKKVLDDSGSPIFIKKTPFYVDGDGSIYIDNQKLAKFQIVQFEDNSILMRAAEGTYVPKNGETPIEMEDISVHQGKLEESNVNVVEEMVQMISLNRSYESSQKALTAQDQSLSKLINQVPRF